MIVDTSALMAIARAEGMAEACLNALEAASSRIVMSAATYLELHVVCLRSKEPLVQQAITDLLDRYDIDVVAFTPDQAAIGTHGFSVYGRGQNHPAKLNFGDCFAYALARERNQPLLFVGDDFTLTDIRSALERS